MVSVSVGLLNKKPLNVMFKGFAFFNYANYHLNVKKYVKF